MRSCRLHDSSLHKRVPPFRGVTSESFRVLLLSLTTSLLQRYRQVFSCLRYDHHHGVSHASQSGTSVNTTRSLWPQLLLEVGSTTAAVAIAIKAAADRCMAFIQYAEEFGRHSGLQGRSGGCCGHTATAAGVCSVTSTWYGLKGAQGKKRKADLV